MLVFTIFCNSTLCSSDEVLYRAVGVTLVYIFYLEGMILEDGGLQPSDIGGGEEDLGLDSPKRGESSSGVGSYLQ